MSLFGNKLAAAEAHVTKLAGLLAVFGYAPASAEDASESDAKTALENIKTSAKAEASTPLNAQIASYRDGLKAAGIELAADTELNAESVTAAIEAHVKSATDKKAVAAVASSGHAQAIDIPSEKTKETPSASDEPENKEDFVATYRAISDPAKRQAYFRKYSKKFTADIV